MSDEQFGLLVAHQKTPIPLRDVSVKAEIQGYVLGLNSTLTYTNESSDPVEVLFRFPLEDSHAVVGLTAVIDGRKIRADIRDKEEARAAYDDAIASGQAAALGEEKSGDVFSISLGNLPPQKNAEIHLQFVGELPIDAEGMVRFSLPSTLKPRYTPSGSVDPLAAVQGAPESQVEHSSVAGVKGFELSVLNASDQIADVSSPTHSIKTFKDVTRDRVIVTLAEERSLDKDLVIQIEHKSPHQATVLVEKGKSGSGNFMSDQAVMVNFFPDFEHSDAACEFIFLVDRSGSMSGSYIKSARDTLILFMKSLPENSRFNIVGFGSRFVHLFPESSVPYNQETLDKAMAHLQDLRADLGGTELLAPLNDIFKNSASPGFSRQVFVLTDGSVSNTNSCIQKVKEFAHSARCFTFGIGSGASTSLVEGLAKAGNGAAEFVKEGERMQPKVIRSLKRALQPSVTNVSVDFKVTGQQCNVLQSPDNLLPIYNGEKLVVYGVLSNVKLPLKGVATLRGQIGEDKIEQPLSFSIEESIEDPSLYTIHHLAAKALIKDWQASRKSKEEIVKLSIEGSVISSHTAFIAVDEESSDAINAPMKTYDIHGYAAAFHNRELLQLVAPRSAMGLMRRMDSLSDDDYSSEEDMEFEEGLGAPMLVMDSCGYDLELENELEEAIGAPLPRSIQMSAGPPPPPVAAAMKPAPKPPTPSNTLSALINAQQANGSWSFDSNLAQHLGKPLNELDSARPKAITSTAIWATVLVLTVLKKKFSSQQDEWELIAMKADSWLKKQSWPEGVSVNDLYKAAEQLP